MKKSIFTTLFGLFVFILYLILAINSYSKYSDEYGTDISFDMDLFVLCICGLIIIIVGLYDLYLNVKVNDPNLKSMEAYSIGLSLLGCITFIYPLGMMFKMISKKEGFEVVSNYLECAIFGAFLLVAGILLFLDYKKKKSLE